ncbi:hypothetical protein [Streptomyces spiramyceticus]|uniref:hypothetical protein n=1 Tax=Streptomyces spiramyceticus TaxID=299717 RepID=UPI00237BCB09|nr:hypothetical protein [Streptomyces spiramyceticus]
MNTTQVSALPRRAPRRTPRWALDPYRPLPADKHRLDLHAALTTTGIAPLPGDLDAIKVLSTLDDATVRTVLRWITNR